MFRFRPSASPKVLRAREDLYFTRGALFKDIDIIRAVRDEAHRFALAHHRKLRSKRLLQSDLDSIPGIGQSRRKKLLQELGSVEAIRHATLEQLSAVVGPQAAQRIQQFFQERQS